MPDQVFAIILKTVERLQRFNHVPEFICDATDFLLIKITPRYAYGEGFHLEAAIVFCGLGEYITEINPKEAAFSA